MIVKPHIGSTERRDVFATRVRRPRNDVDGHVVGCPGPHGATRFERLATHVSPAKEDQYPADVSGTSSQLACRIGEFFSKQGVLRPEEKVAVLRNQRSIAFFWRSMQVLIKKDLAVVRAVGDVIYDQNAEREVPNTVLPDAIEGIVIYNQPVCWSVAFAATR
jgi:hypothetical protein